jgi:hypothetical protein
MTIKGLLCLFERVTCDSDGHTELQLPQHMLVLDVLHIEPDLKPFFVFIDQALLTVHVVLPVRRDPLYE